MDRFGLDQKYEGKSMHEYISYLLEKNENKEIEIERLKGSIGLLKQANNQSRLMLDSAKLALKEKEFKQAHDEA